MAQLARTYAQPNGFDPRKAVSQPRFYHDPRTFVSATYRRSPPPNIGGALPQNKQTPEREGLVHAVLDAAETMVRSKVEPITEGGLLPGGAFTVASALGVPDSFAAKLVQQLVDPRFRVPLSRGERLWMKRWVVANAGHGAMPAQSLPPAGRMTFTPQAANQVRNEINFQHQNGTITLQQAQIANRKLEQLQRTRAFEINRVDQHLRMARERAAAGQAGNHMGVAFRPQPPSVRPLVPKRVIPGGFHPANRPPWVAARPMARAPMPQNNAVQREARRL